MENRLNNIIMKFLDRVHLDRNRILATYIYALAIIPLFFGAFIFFEATVTKQSLSNILSSTPQIAIDMIMTIADFILGYYLWMKKDKVLSDLSTYRFFMLCQAFSQILAGNLFCVLLAIFGVVQTSKVRISFNGKNKMLRIACIAFFVVFCFCLALIILLRNKG